MFREIKTREKIEVINDRKQKAYMQIKPEKELSEKELNDMISGIFAEASEAM